MTGGFALLAGLDGWLVHGYAVAASAVACGIGHLAGRVVLRQRLSAADAAERSQAPLLAMLVRMFVAVPLLLAAIFAAGVLFADVGEHGSPGRPRFVAGLWAAAAYAVMVVLEARSVSRTYQHHVNRSAQHGSDDEDAS